MRSPSPLWTARRVLAALTLALAVSTAPASAQALGRVQITATGADIRQGPSLQSAIIGSIGQGTLLEIIGQSGLWYEVTVPAELRSPVRRGYIPVSAGALVAAERGAVTPAPSSQNAERYAAAPVAPAAASQAAPRVAPRVAPGARARMVCAGTGFTAQFRHHVAADYNRSAGARQVNPVGGAYAMELGVPADAPSIDGTILFLGASRGSAGDFDDLNLRGLYSAYSSNPSNQALSLCATTGFEYTAGASEFAGPEWSYVDIPFVVSLSYTLGFGRNVALVPFVAPALHSYREENRRYIEWGRDFSAELGAVAYVGPVSVSFGYDWGNNRFDEDGRLRFGAGIGF